MAQKKGLVRSVSKDGWAMAVTERDDACSNCESAQFCHSLADCSRMETRVLNRANAEVGDRVIISLSSRNSSVADSSRTQTQIIAKPNKISPRMNHNDQNTN